MRKNAISQVYNLFRTGKWLNTYELPFFNDTYLEADQYQNWNTGNLETSGGDSKSLQTFIKGSMNIDFPMSPVYKITDIGNTGYKNLDFEFYLINKNNYWLERNFRFLHAFYAGTQWLQLDYGMIQGSNVYNVLCPGRFNIIWAAIGSKITHVGKLRKNQYMDDRFPGIGSIDENTLWPDAWKVEIHIKDLTPNNFNMYMNYYINGSKESLTLARNITTTNNESNTLKKVLNAFTPEQQKVLNDLREQQKQKIGNQQSILFVKQRRSNCTNCYINKSIKSS